MHIRGVPQITCIACSARGVDGHQNDASREGGAAWVVPSKESCFLRSMSVGTTIRSTRFRAATVQPSSAMYAERRADTASANKKLITPERTKSDVPVAFLTFLFARLHVDDMPKTEGTQLAIFVLLAIWPSPPQERAFAGRSGRAHTEATMHPVHSFPGWANFRIPPAIPQRQRYGVAGWLATRPDFVARDLSGHKSPREGLAGARTRCASDVGRVRNIRSMSARARCRRRGARSLDASPGLGEAQHRASGRAMRHKKSVSSIV